MLDIFDSNEVQEERKHDKFKLLRDILVYGEQDVLKSWTEGFIDRDNKIVKEFQTTFHSSFWEFFLNALFKEADFEIDYTKNRPDFIITRPQKMYVEAVVSNIKETGRKEGERNVADTLSMIQPFYKQKNFKLNLSEAVTRYSNSIQNKAIKKYSDYKKDKHFDESLPYLIALSGYEQVNYGNNFVFPMMALLYGQVYNNLTNMYSSDTAIEKPNTKSTIPIGIFLDDEYSHISAIIFSCTVTLGKLTSLAISQGYPHPNGVMTIRQDCEPPPYKIQLVSTDSPEYLSDGIFIFHNPLAKHPISTDLFDKTNAINFNYDIDKKMTLRQGNNLPIVSRFNNFVLKQTFPLMAKEITEDFNPELFSVVAKVRDYLEVDSHYEVDFVELESQLEFSMEIEKELFKKYKIDMSRQFIIVAYLNLDIKLYTLLVSQPDLFEKIKKIKGLIEGEASIIDIVPQQY